MSLYRKILNNIKAISPEHHKLLNSGFCNGLGHTWAIACAAGDEQTFRHRLQQWLGRDFASNPLTVDDKTYYSFSDIMLDFEKYRGRKDNSPQMTALVEKMIDTLAFLDVVATFQSSKPTPLDRIVNRQADKIFASLSPVTLDKLGDAKRITMDPIYDHTWRIPEDSDVFANFLEDINRSIVSKDKNFIQPVILLNSGSHVIGLTKRNNQWYIFDQNNMGEKNLYHRFSKEKVAKFLYNVEDINVKVLFSPYSMQPQWVEGVRQAFENFPAHKQSQQIIEAAVQADPRVITFAAMFNQINKIKQWQKQGINIDTPDPAGVTPLLRACRKGHFELAQFLIEKGANIERNNTRGTPIVIAANFGYLDFIKYLQEKGAALDERDRQGNNALHLAARNGYLDVVQFFVEKGLNIETLNNDGETALHLAALEGRLEIIQYLDSLGADVTKKNNSNATLIHAAAVGGNVAVIQYLMKKGLRLDVKDDIGMTPLHFAAREGQNQMVEFLLAQGANIDETTDDGITPLNYAAFKGHLHTIEFLYNKGANIHSTESTIGIAAQQGHLDIITFLLSKGVDINEKNTNGATPLMVAAFQGNIKLIDFLLARGADVNAANQDGGHAIILALSQKQRATVEFLITKGAMLTLETDEQQKKFLHQLENMDDETLLSTLQVLSNKNMLPAAVVVDIASLLIQKIPWKQPGQAMYSKPMVMYQIENTLNLVKKQQLLSPTEALDKITTRLAQTNVNDPVLQEKFTQLAQTLKFYAHENKSGLKTKP